MRVGSAVPPAARGGELTIHPRMASRPTGWGLFSRPTIHEDRDGQCANHRRTDCADRTHGSGCEARPSARAHPCQRMHTRYRVLRRDAVPFEEVCVTVDYFVRLGSALSPARPHEALGQRTYRVKQPRTTRAALATGLPDQRGFLFEEVSAVT